MKKLLKFTFILRIIAWFFLNYFILYEENSLQINSVFRSILLAVNTFLTANILIEIIGQMVVSVYLRRKDFAASRSNFVLGITRVSTVINIVMVLVCILIAFGINPKDFITSLTIVAMALTLIFKEYLTNMISGWIIMFSDQFSIGDRVKIGNYQGQIVDITLANLVVKDEDEDAVLVPNNLVFTSAIMNKTSQKSEKLLIKFDLPFSEAMNVSQMKKQLYEVLEGNTMIDWQKPFEVNVGEIGHDHIKYKVAFTSTSSLETIHQQLRNIILNTILENSTKSEN